MKNWITGIGASAVVFAGVLALAPRVEAQVPPTTPLNPGYEWVWQQTCYWGYCWGAWNVAQAGAFDCNGDGTEECHTSSESCVRTDASSDWECAEHTLCSSGVCGAQSCYQYTTPVSVASSPSQHPNGVLRVQAYCY